MNLIRKVFATPISDIFASGIATLIMCALGIAAILITGAPAVKELGLGPNVSTVFIAGLATLLISFVAVFAAIYVAGILYHLMIHLLRREQR